MSHPDSARSRLRLALPVYCCAITLVMTAGLRSVFPPFALALLFLPAVIVSARYAGTLAGLEAAALSALASAYFFLPPARSLAVGRAGALQVALFLLASAALSLRVAGEKSNRGLPEVLAHPGRHPDA